MAETILVCDDEELIRWSLSEQLRTDGYNVVEAVNGRDCLEKLKAVAPALVFLDLKMPVLDGVGAVREIRAREAASGRRRTPVIALTANAMTHQVAELLAAGMDFHVAKPIDAGQLFTAMEAALELADMAAEPPAA